MNQLANRPAFLGQSSNVIDALAGGLGSAQPPRISTSDDRFQPLDENGTPTMPAQLELDVVIVGANPHKSRVYYEGDYDPKDLAPPDCWSDNGVGPSEHAINPQHATCAGCPRAVWGKLNAKGNTVPWCQERKKAAVWVVGSNDDTVYLLSVPPKSHKSSLQPYIESLRRQGADVSDVVTTVGIKDKVWTFTAKAWLPNEKTAAYVKEVVNGDMPMNVVNAYDKPRQGALPALAALASSARLSAYAPEDQPEEGLPASTAVEAVAEKFITPAMEVQIDHPWVAQRKAGPSEETKAKLDSLFAKFGPAITAQGFSPK